MRTKAFRIFLHGVIWLAVYLLPYAFSFDRFSLFQPFNVSAELLHIVSTLLLIAYTYLNYHLLVPALFLHRKYFVYGGVAIGCLLIVIWFPQVFRHVRSGEVLPPLHSDGPPPFGNGRPPNGPPGRSMDGPTSTLISKISYNIILFVISTFACISIRQQRQLLEVQKEKVDAELSFLRAQINPHFLFNTLNSIYALAITKSNDTPKAIIQLSELMRYILKDSEADAVPLERELSYISNYIALQKQRLENTVQIHYTAPATVAGQRVAPLILTSFVENAFKHGVNPSEDSVITIAISLQAAQLQLLVTNNKVTSVGQPETMGIGLKNARSRLQHLYPGKHQLTIEETSNTFSVNLVLTLND